MTILDDEFAADLKAGRGWFIPASALSEPAAASLNKLISRAMYGGSADIILRVDAVETRWQADWIKYARPLPSPLIAVQAETKL